MDEGCLVVMGDNRNRSADSRYASIGQIEESQVIGKVLCILFPGCGEAARGTLDGSERWTMDERMNIQWYPGHMTKTRRNMEADLKLVDAVCEIVDARIPFSSRRNPDIDAICGRSPHDDPQPHRSGRSGRHGCLAELLAGAGA